MLDRYRNGDQAAATAIYDRYYDRVVRLARNEIGSLLRRVVTPESVAMSVLDSLIKGIGRGYGVDASGSLSAPIRVITKNKVRSLWEYWTAKIRDIRQLIYADRLPEPTPRNQSPDASVILADLLDHIRSLLPADLFEILTLRLEGLSHNEIADRLGVTRQTVTRKLKQLQEWWRRWAKARESSR
jgi:RNA polymerase sigma factor (sigma-70 family)